MSDEKKEIDVDEIKENVRSDNKDSAWGDSWCVAIILMALFGGFGNRETADHELRERVARLEGKIDMIKGNRHE